MDWLNERVMMKQQQRNEPPRDRAVRCIAPARTAMSTAIIPATL